MFKRILIPLDRSRIAEMVLPYAVEIATKFGSELYLATVTEVGTNVTDPSYLAYLETVFDQIKSQAHSYGFDGQIKTFTKVLSGKPPGEILRYSNEIDASLIAMASHGESGRGTWSLGKIASKILQATNRPVLLIRTQTSETVSDHKKLVKKILIPLDGSELGEGAIPLVRALAEGFEAEIVLFNVDEPQITWGMYEGYPGHTTPPPNPAIREEAIIKYLETIAKPLKEGGLIVSNIVAFGLPARQIIDYSKANNVDLVAMSTHGRSGIAGWIFGSVTEKVLNAGDVPLLVVRPSKK